MHVLYSRSLVSSVHWIDESYFCLLMDCVAWNKYFRIDFDMLSNDFDILFVLYINDITTYFTVAWTEIHYTSFPVTSL